MITRDKIDKTYLFWISFGYFCFSEILAKSTNETIPNDEGRKTAWVWMFEIINGSVGIVYNALCLYLLLILETKHSFYELNITLNVIDLCFSIQRVCVDSTFYVYRGLHYGKPFCVMQAGSELMPMIWSSFGKSIHNSSSSQSMLYCDVFSAIGYLMGCPL